MFGLNILHAKINDTKNDIGTQTLARGKRILNEIELVIVGHWVSDKWFLNYYFIGFV